MQIKQHFRRAYLGCHPSPVRCLLLLTLAAAYIAVHAPDVYARAGGGEGFSGGGDGGGSGGSDGGIVGALLELLIYVVIRLCIEYPVIGIPLLAVIIIVFIVAGRNQVHRSQDRTILRGAHAVRAGAHINAQKVLIQADPSFDPTHFTTRIKGAFLRLQEGWCAQDVSAIRPFVSDGVLERFSLQFQEQQDEGYRNHMEDIRIAGVQLVDASVGPVFECATVMISAAAVDYKVDLQTGKRIGTEDHSGLFTEFWTLVRRRGGPVSDTAKPGLLEGRCPNCGAPIDFGPDPSQVGHTLKCSSCGSALLSGSHDWVLAEITQVTATGAPASFDPPSVAHYQQTRDAGFSCAHMEDRASVAFWRWAKAQRIGHVKPLLKMADRSFSDTMAVQIKSRTDARAGVRTFTGHCAIGSVQTLGILPGPERDRAIVTVEWSASTLSLPLNAPPKTRPKVINGEGLYCVSVLTLARNKGVTTDPLKGLSSAHCPTCGAPESDSADDSCTYCGRVLNDGSGDWVVLDVVDQSSPTARALIAELAQASNPSEDSSDHDSDTVATIDAQPLPQTSDTAPTPIPDNALGLAAWVARVIVSDGIVTPRELELFNAFCARQALSAHQAQAVLDTARREVTPQNTVSQPAGQEISSDQAQQWLAHLASSIHTTGAPTPEDRQLLRLAAVRLGLTIQDAQNAEKAARDQALTQARAAIKQQKNNPA